METGERNQVNSQFSKIRVQLTGESQTTSNTGHSGRDQVVQVTIGGGSQFKSSETDIIKGFVINDHTFIGVFNQLMDRQSSVVGFNDGIRHFRRGDNGESFHDSVGIFFSDFGNQEGTHTRSGTTTQRVSDLETL
jgi:hypothetical protein